jgi:cold shock CspA family protein
MSETDASKPKRLTGRVKWFNNKTGFGFITALEDAEGVSKVSDVFVHHSTIKVEKEQYRYLVQGEYLEFELSKITDSSSKHEFQAANVSGVKGGKLICETRLENRSAESSGGASRPKRAAVESSNSNSNSNSSKENAGEWTKVEGRKPFAPRQSGGSQWRRGSSAPSRGRGGKGTDSNNE